MPPQPLSRIGRHIPRSSQNATDPARRNIEAIRKRPRRQPASIGALLRPGKTIAVSISDNDWLQPSLPTHQALITFLHELAGLPKPDHGPKK